jgi:hypothetical protein
VYPASWRLGPGGQAASLGVPQEDIVRVHFTDDAAGHCPKFAVFLDHPTSSLVLAVRGTFSLKDVVLDIVCDETPLLDRSGKLCLVSSLCICMLYFVFDPVCIFVSVQVT